MKGEATSTQGASQPAPAVPALYVFNTGWLLAERVFRFAFAIVVTAIVGRHLGTADFGVLNYGISLISIVAVFGGLGLEQVLVRELVREASRTAELFSTALCMRVGVSAILIVSTALVLPFTAVAPVEQRVIVVLSIGILFQSLEVVDYLYQAQVNSRVMVMVRLVQLVLSSVLRIALVWLDAPLIAFAVATALDGLLLATGYGMACHRHAGVSLGWKGFDRKLMTRLFSEAWPLLLSGLVVVVYMRIDQVMIRNMMGASDLGLYAAAVRISEAWYFIPMAISASLFPWIVRLREESDDAYRLAMRRLYGLVIWISAAFAMAVSMFSDWIVATLYGAEFFAASGVLSIHVWGGVFAALGVVSGRWMINERLQMLALARTVCGAVINILLNWVLIPRHGLIGAAVATLLAQLSAAWLFDLAVPRTRPVFIQKATAAIYPFWPTKCP